MSKRDKTTPEVSPEAITVVAPVDREPAEWSPAEGSNRYLRLARIAESPPHEVWRAEDRRLRREVALHVARAADAAGELAFHREARILSQLEHPAIPPVYDLFAEDGALARTERRPEGRPLDVVLRSPRGADAPTRVQLLAVLSKVCLAIHFAHERGVAHTDLSASRVLLGSYGDVYVLDWHRAKVVNELSPTETKEAHRSDLSALGAILVGVLDATKTGADPSEELEAMALRASGRGGTAFRGARELADALDAYLERDRDLDRRRSAARVHLERARLLAESLPDERGPEHPKRKEALGAVSQALALEPTNPAPREVLRGLLAIPPLETPAAVSAELVTLARSQQLRTSRAALLGFAAWFALLPLLFAAGIREARAMWLLLASFGTMVLVSARLSRRPEREGRAPWLAIVGGPVAFAALSAICGPLILAPTGIVSNTAALLLMQPDRWRRTATILAGSLALVGPLALEWLGVLPPSYVIEAGQLVILPRLINLTPWIVLSGLACAHVALLFVVSLWFILFRDALDDAQTKLYAQAWQLRQIVPPVEALSAAAGDHAGSNVPDTRPSVSPPTPTDVHFGRPASRVHPGDADDLARLRSDDERYRLRGRLGAGGMGDVVLSFDRRLGREVARKNLLPAHWGKTDMRDLFLREAQLQAKLEHPGIVPVYDLRLDARPYFTMRRVNGTTLENILKGTPGQWRPTLRSLYSRRKLVSAVSSASLVVDLAHTRGIVHCDLKPANIMLGDYGELYVLDWGVAAEVDPATGRARKHTAGTLGYAAPESIGGEGVDSRADVYALGAILFEVLTGRPLHEGKTLRQILDSTLGGAEARASVRAPDRDVPPELEAVCVKATALDPKHRFPTARAFHDALERFLEGERDFEGRRALARKVAARAREAAAHPLDPARRSLVMHDIVRALALDETNTSATALLLQLLTEPPKELPPSAATEMRAAQRADQRRAALGGAAMMATWFLYVPVAVHLGVRDARMFAVVCACFALSIFGELYTWRTLKTHSGTPLVPVALAAIAIGSLSGMLGPFVLVPTLALAASAAFLLQPERTRRPLVVALFALSVLAPLALGQLHVIPPSYLFEHGVVVAVPHLVNVDSSPAVGAILGVHVVFLVSVGIYFMRLGDLLLQAQARVHTHAWQLRMLIPESAQRATTVAPPKE